MTEARSDSLPPIFGADSPGMPFRCRQAIAEELSIKQELFVDLDRICKPGAILASNTSYQDIDRIAAVTGRPQDVLGMHFFSPANVMKLLEVVRAD